ncbi:MAG: CHAT domain-containing protein [Deltaproteobacteria bacterium]|uniref:CHAT domain-containing protein n=1 Tax=Candidatus Zymogenus saltonus TaxID=2844893 RepID=A0A9D8KCX2_9DELT|nr:CHAT domain-containing protein [Candidatus Zymogenus saltonus]
MKRIAPVLLALFVFIGTISAGPAAGEENKNIYFDKGNEFMGKSDYTSALENYEKALDQFKKGGDKRGMGDTLIRMGVALSAQNRLDEAVYRYREAIVSFSEVDDKSSLARVYRYLGDALQEQTKYQEAVSSFEEALKIYRELSDKGNETRCLISMGKLYNLMGKRDKGLLYFEEALVIARELGDKSGEARLLRDIGAAYSALSDHESALVYYEKGLELYEKLVDKRGAGDTLIDLGNVYKRLGRKDDALSAFRRALEIFDESEDYRVVVMINIYTGVLLEESVKHKESIESFEKGLEISRKAHNRRDEALCLKLIGKVYDIMAQYEKALSCFSEALAISEELSDKAYQAEISRDIAGTYTSLSDYKNALPYYERSLKLYRELNNKSGEAYCLVGIASLKNNVETPLEAREIYTQALEIFRETGDPVGEGFALAGIGFSYYLTGNKVKMAYYYSKVLRITKKHAPTLEVAKDPLILGMLYAGKEDYKKAIKYLKPALKKGAEIDNINYLGFSAAYLGYSYMHLKDYEKAVDYYKIAIDAVEKVRGEIGGEAHRTTYAKGKIDAYEYMIWTLIQLKRYDDAFDYMERSRSRSFLDMLGTKNVVVGGESDRELIKREENLRETLARLYDEDGDGSPDENVPEGESGEILTDKIKTRKITEVKKEYNELIDEMKVSNPELASLVSVNPMTLKEVQALIPEGTRILEFYTTTEYDLFVFSVTRSDFTVTTVKITRDEALEKVKEFKSSLNSLDLEDFKIKSKKMYDLILSDVLKDADEEKLIVIPHGPLHYLPFSALYDGKDYLIDRYTLIVDPSASVLRFIVDKRKKPEGKVLALGNPKTKYDPLPFAEREVGEINEVMADVDAYIRNGATETLGKKRFSDYRIIHLACHGKFKGESPLSSALYLTGDRENDGLLMVNELFGLNLKNASLVVLSACETGLSQIMRGDELIGLSRGFIYAGTPSLVVTLWEVADNSTALFMIELYENLKTGMDKPTALRKAQLSLKSAEKFSHPFYWAPFVIMGDWE